MKAGMSIAGAEARLQTLASGLASEHPATNAGWSVRLLPLAEELAGTSRLELLLVFAAMFCLLLLLCANVASLAIARGVARAREMAIRLAFGASGQPRHTTADRRKRVERDRHPGHRHGAHHLVGGRGAVGCAHRPAAPPRGGHERARRLVCRRACAAGHRARQRGADLPRHPHLHRRGAQGRRGGIGQRVRPLARGSGGGRDRRRGDAAGRRRPVGADLCRVAARGRRFRHPESPGAAYHARRHAVSHRRAHHRVLRSRADAIRASPGRHVGGSGDLAADELDWLRVHPALLARARSSRGPRSGRRQHPHGDAGLFRDAGPAVGRRTRVHGLRRCDRAPGRGRQPEAGPHRLGRRRSRGAHPRARLPGRHLSLRSGRRRPRRAVRRPAKRAGAGDLHSARAEPISGSERDRPHHRGSPGRGPDGAGGGAGCRPRSAGALGDDDGAGCWATPSRWTASRCC